MEKNLSRRQFLRAASITSAAATLAACGAAPTPTALPSTATKPPAPPTATPVPTAKPKVKISWAVWVSGPVDRGNLGEKAMNERFNVELTQLAFERTTWADQINTRVAGGDVPDIIYRDSQAVVYQYVDQGILAEVPYDMVKKFAPKTFAAVNQFTIEAWLACRYKAKNYGLPFMQPFGLAPMTDAWRKDWLDKLGITKIPGNLQEYEDAFTKLVKNDPDGNGKADTFALCPRGKDDRAAAHTFFAAYGTIPNRWFMVGDKLQYGGILDGAKQALTLLQDWTKKGLIDPEFITTDWALLKKKFLSEKLGYIETTWYRLYPGTEVYDGMKDSNPKAVLAMADAPKGPDGKFGYSRGAPISSSICFGKHLAKDPDKLALALQMVEAMCADTELSTLLRFGKEGENCQRDTESGALLFKPPFDKAENRGPLGTWFWGAMLPIPTLQYKNDRKDIEQLMAKANAGNLTNMVPSATSFWPSDAAKKFSADLTPIHARWYNDFISGAKPMDQWGQFLREWDAAGYQAIADAANGTWKDAATEIAAIKAAVT